MAEGPYPRLLRQPKILLLLIYKIPIVLRVSLVLISHSLAAPISCFNYNYLYCTSAM